MATIIFFPVGTADSTLIQLDNQDLILIDYANMKTDKNDPRCDLAKELSAKLEKWDKDRFRVVCFSHLDNDHVNGMSNFFWLEHAKKYQLAGRPKIDELWVPATAITESGVEGDARIVREEAKYRLKQGIGIKVFSHPNQLESFLKDNNLTVESRKNCIVEAGQTIPGFSLVKPEHVEFFVHAPLAWKTNNGVEDRNPNSIVFQATFNTGESEARALFGSDIDSETLADIVNTTKRHKNAKRLEWELLKVFHHCSYKVLDKDSDDPNAPITPIEEAHWLIKEQASNKCVMVSSSSPIPPKDTKGANPPHKRAADYYKNVSKEKDGKFWVTMEYPSESNPKPLEFLVDDRGITKQIVSAVSSVSTAVTTPTRAG